MPQFQQLASFPSQILWLVVSFVILYIVLSRFIVPRLKAIRAQREHERTKNLNDADALMEQAKEALKEAAEILDDAKKKANAIISEAETEAQNVANASIAEAQAKIATSLKEASEQLDNERQQAIDSFASTQKELAEEIVLKITDGIIEPKIAKASVQAVSENRQ